MQSVDQSRVDEARDCTRAAFDKNALEAALCETIKNVAGIETSTAALKLYHLGAIGCCGGVMPLNDDHRRTVIIEQSFLPRQFSFAVDDDTRWAWSLDFAHGEPGIVVLHRADTDDDRVHERTAPMQVRQTIRSGNVAGIACRRCDAPIERLTDLRDNETVASCCNRTIKH